MKKKVELHLEKGIEKTPALEEYMVQMRPILLGAWETMKSFGEGKQSLLIKKEGFPDLILASVESVNINDSVTYKLSNGMTAREEDAT